MNWLGYIITVLLPLLLVACKLGILLSTWVLLAAMARLVAAATKYLNAKTYNEALK